MNNEYNNRGIYNRKKYIFLSDSILGKTKLSDRAQIVEGRIWRRNPVATAPIHSL